MTMNIPPKPPRSSFGSIFAPLVPKKETLRKRGTVALCICGAIELVLGAMLYTINFETLGMLGVEFNVPMASYPFIGWAFAAVPTVTSQHLLAALTAVTFVVIPVFCFVTQIDASILKIPRQAEIIGRKLSLAVFVFIVLNELAAIFYRAVQPVGFRPKDDIDVLLGALFGGTTAILSICAGYFSATVICARATSKD